MLRCWNRLLAFLRTPHVPRFLMVARERFRRELELWRWRRDYGRHFEGPHESAHPVTRVFGVVPPSETTPDPAPWPQASAPRVVASRAGSNPQLNLF